MNHTSHNTFTAAMATIEELYAQGFTSFKLYKSDTFWWVGLSNVCVNDWGEKL